MSADERSDERRRIEMAHRAWMLAAALALLAGPVLAGTGRPSREDIASDKAALFKQADADGDGELSPTEFEAFRQLVRAKMAERHFARADTDGDGKLSLAELEAARPHHGGCRHGGGEAPPE
jgi:hypothetical protein